MTSSSSDLVAGFGEGVETGVGLGAGVWTGVGVGVGVGVCPIALPAVRTIAKDKEKQTDRNTLIFI